MSKFLVLVGAFFLTIGVAGAEEKKGDPRPEMQLLLQDIKALEVYLVSEKDFIDPKNESAIDERLKHMSKHIAGMQGKNFKNDPALQMNINMLNRHMEDTKQFFENKNKPFARFMLRSALQMCIGCHTRMNSGVELDFPSDSKLSMGPDTAFERAEFYFATRQFAKAVDVFKQIVDAYPKNNEKLYNLSRSLNNLAIYYARVHQNPKEAADYFTKISKKQALPAYMQKDLSAWAQSFRAWAKIGTENEDKKLKDTELLKKAKDLLRKDNFNLVGDSDRKFHIDRLHASALLHKILDMPQNSMAKGEALYLLGLIYHRVDNSLFFHFDEMYLKACITDYKKTKLAQDCYDALEDVLLDGYTGSGGTNLPNDVELELIKLKKLAY